MGIDLKVWMTPLMLIAFTRSAYNAGRRVMTRRPTDVKVPRVVGCLVVGQLAFALKAVEYFRQQARGGWQGGRRTVVFMQFSVVWYSPLSVKTH